MFPFDFGSGGADWGLGPSFFGGRGGGSVVVYSDYFLLEGRISHSFILFFFSFHSFFLPLLFFVIRFSYVIVVFVFDLWYISSNGGQNEAGGGAGGSVFLNVSTLTCFNCSNSFVQADGSQCGFIQAAQAGSGGGGRIALYNILFLLSFPLLFIYLFFYIS